MDNANDIIDQLAVQWPAFVALGVFAKKHMEKLFGEVHGMRDEVKQMDKRLDKLEIEVRSHLSHHHQVGCPMSIGLGSNDKSQSIDGCPVSLKLEVKDG